MAATLLLGVFGGQHIGGAVVVIAGIEAAVRVRFPPLFQRPASASMVIHPGPALGAEQQPRQGIGLARGVRPAYCLP